MVTRQIVISHINHCYVVSKQLLGCYVLLLERCGVVGFAMVF